MYTGRSFVCQIGGGAQPFGMIAGKELHKLTKNCNLTHGESILICVKTRIWTFVLPHLV